MLPESDGTPTLQLLSNDERQLDTAENAVDAVIISFQKRLRRVYAILAVLTIMVLLLIWSNFRHSVISSPVTYSGVATFKDQELQLLDCR